MENNFLSSNEFKSQLSMTGKSPIARLNGLSNILNTWNQARTRGAQSLAADLSINDISILKDIIHTEIDRLSLKNAEVISDQILFMIIGAMKLQLQNNSTQPWALVSQSISSFTSTQKSKKAAFMSLAFITLLVGIGMTAKNSFLHKNTEAPDIFRTADVSSVNDLGNATVNNLIGMHLKMKEGNCQLPQAAMLQPQDREAFMAFINEGKVEIATAANLKSALGYVHCLYPQKLMDKPLQNNDSHS